MGATSYVTRSDHLSGDKIATFLVGGEEIQAVVLVDSDKTELTVLDVETQARDDANVTATLTFAGDTTHSEWESMNGKPLLGLVIPILTAAETLVTFEITIDGGTTPLALVQSDGSTPGIEVTGGTTAIAVSTDFLTPLAGYCGAECEIRVVLDKAQDANRDFVFLTQP